MAQRPKDYAKMAQYLAKRFARLWAPGAKVTVEGAEVTVNLASKFTLTLSLGSEGGEMNLINYWGDSELKVSSISTTFDMEWHYFNQIVPRILKSLTCLHPDLKDLKKALGFLTAEGKERRQIIIFHHKHGNIHYLVGEDGPAAVFLAWFKRQDENGWYCMSELPPLPLPEPYEGSDPDLRELYNKKAARYEERLRDI